ncbi:MAG TPA: M23 family metallopeptidase [Cyclobacteriaceae bacterium]|nr:M23 family metallopeptidase [Cyclobacteriaceae bacterium]
MSSKKTLSSWLTTKYQLIIRNEENLSERTPAAGFTYAKLIVIIFIFSVIAIISSLFLARTLLAQWFDPRYAVTEANKRIIELSLKVDSMQYEAMRKEMFINTFKSILTQDFKGLDSTASIMIENPASFREADLDYLTPIDSQIRVEFEKQGDLYAGLNTQYSMEFQDIYLFSPISGIVSAPFDLRKEHYGVDIVAKTDEPVKCIADGSVLIASWTQDSGYVIVVQHRNNLISVYKHNSALLKKVGNLVSAGEIIAFIGNTGELTTGPHLHFELWMNGNPVDPEDFVSL